MPTEFENEAKEITLKLKPAEGYLECEKVIIDHIKKYLITGKTPIEIGPRLKRLLEYLQEMIVTNKDSSECINFRYAEGFLKTLVETPYWQSWIRNG